MLIIKVDWLVDLFNVRVRTITAIWIIGDRFKSTPTNETRFTAPGLPWRSPIRVLSEVEVS